MKKVTAILLTISILLSSIALTTYADEPKETYRTFTNNYSIECDGPHPNDETN